MVPVLPVVAEAVKMSPLEGVVLLESKISETLTCSCAYLLAAASASSIRV